MERFSGKFDRFLKTTSIIKYAFTVILTLITYHTTGQVMYCLAGLVEFVLIAIISDMVFRKNKIVAYVVNSTLLLFYNLQMGVLFFAGSYIQLVMVTNLGMVEDLQGKALQYGLGLTAVIVFSFLPVKCTKNPLSTHRVLQWGMLGILAVIAPCFALWIRGGWILALWRIHKPCRAGSETCQNERRNNGL